MAARFYPKGNATAALPATLATFGAEFAARPFGALFFGRIGDLIGRKYAFLVTLLREAKDNTITGIETRQRGDSPAVFGGLIAPSIAGLVAADQWLTPTLGRFNDSFSVQDFFRLLVAVIIIASATVAVRHRRNEADARDVQPQAGD